MMKRLAAVSLLMLGALAVAGRAGTPRFYDDDPLQRVPESADASGAGPQDISLFYEEADGLFVLARRPPSGLRAQNLNTIDEVPDSGWFTNRAGAVPLSAAEVAQGPNQGAPPAPERWTIVREKSAGVNPGFTARDANGETWFLSFDEPEYPRGGSGAIEISTKLFWALGYNQIETYITTFDPARAAIDPAATYRRPNGERTPFTRSDLSAILGRAARNSDGTYRASAGRALRGKVLGPFRYKGTRPDDPNDLVAHEHRRELRALRVFGAWTNLVDMKAGNTLDALTPRGSGAVITHYLQDVGSTLGLANRPHEWDKGWEYLFDGSPAWKRLLTFGFAPQPWRQAKYDEYPSIGRFEGDVFDPLTWRPHAPMAAYVEMRADDAFWAARRVAAFSDDLIRAAVRTGDLDDPAAEQHLASVIGKRRDKIVAAYLPAINPIVEPRLDGSGRLTFANAAVDAGVATAALRYAARWFWFDNATGERSPMGETAAAGPSVAPPPEFRARNAPYVVIDIRAEDATHPSWDEPVRTYFKRTSGGWTLVGLERQP